MYQVKVVFHVPDDVDFADFAYLLENEVNLPEGVEVIHIDA